MSDTPAKLDAAIREALAQIQRNGILCTHSDLAEQQLQGATRVLMYHLAKKCPELIAVAETKSDLPAAVK